MGIYKRNFDLIASGRKTTEIRVNHSRRHKITESSLIRFRRREALGVVAIGIELVDPPRQQSWPPDVFVVLVAWRSLHEGPNPGWCWVIVRSRPAGEAERTLFTRTARISRRRQCRTDRGG